MVWRAGIFFLLASTRRCLVSTAVENNATFTHTATTDSVNRLCSTVSISAPAEAAELSFEAAGRSAGAVFLLFTAAWSKFLWRFFCRCQRCNDVSFLSFRCLLFLRVFLMKAVAL